MNNEKYINDLYGELYGVVSRNPIHFLYNIGIVPSDLKILDIWVDICTQMKDKYTNIYRHKCYYHYRRKGIGIERLFIPYNLTTKDKESIIRIIDRMPISYLDKMTLREIGIVYNREKINYKQYRNKIKKKIKNLKGSMTLKERNVCGMLSIL